MKISWCQEHESGTASSDKSCDLFLTGRYSVPCRMVPMRLIPDNALLLTECSDMEFSLEADRRNNRPTKGGIVVAAPVPVLDGETP